MRGVPPLIAKFSDSLILTTNSLIPQICASISFYMWSILRYPRASNYVTIFQKLKNEKPATPISGALQQFRRCIFFVNERQTLTARKPLIYRGLRAFLYALYSYVASLAHQQIYHFKAHLRRDIGGT